MIAVMTRFAMPAFRIWQVRSASFFGGMLIPAPSLYGSRMMAATQRVVEYAKLQPEEGSFAPPGCDVLDTWPARGDVVLRDVRLRYAPELPQALFYRQLLSIRSVVVILLTLRLCQVLRGVSLTIAHSERLGLCGRTGAGKSSILLAIFNMAAEVSPLMRDADVH